MSQAEALLNSLTETVINHTHPVPDSDTHFIIDPYTRQIENTNYQKTVIMRGDHNSERFTFELPRYVDGHDMSLCNRVIVHFDNVGDSIENIYSDVAYMDDLRINPDKPDTVISSWLIRREATQIVGLLSFSLQYQCVEGDEVTYEWNTDSCDEIEIRKSKSNGEAAIIKYTNVLEEWRAKIFGAGDSIMSNITTEGANQVAAVQNESATQQAAIELKGSETLATIPDDYTEVYNMATEAVRTKADGIVCEAEGSAITIDDASNDYIRGLTVYGRSTQMTTTGKNLFDVSKIANNSRVTNDNGVITVSTPEASSAVDSMTDLGVIAPELEVGKSYTLTFETTGTDRHIYLEEAKFMWSNGGTNTVTQEMLDSDVLFYASGVSTTATLTNFMLRDSAIADATYEPYTGGIPAPNPEYPQEIVSVEKPTVEIYGKNLIPYPYNQTTLTTNGITFTTNSDGTVTANGTCTDTAYFSLWNISSYDYAVPLSRGVYTLSGAPAQYCRIAIGVRKSKTATREAISAYVAQPYTFEVDNDTTRFDIICTVDKGVTINNVVFRPQLEVGDIVTNYEPYVHPQSIPLANTLHGIPVTSGGNYTDENGQQWICDEVDLERGVYIQRIFSETFTDFNDEINYSHDANGTSCALAVGKQLVATMGMCSHLPLTINTTGNNRFNPIDGVIYFKLNGELTFEDLKATLTEMSPTVIAILATPIETPLTVEEIETFKSIKTNYPNTTILNGSGAWMKAKYNADTKLYISNAAVDGAVSAVEEVLNDTY